MDVGVQISLQYPLFIPFGYTPSSEIASLYGSSKCLFSHVLLFETPWTLACQAPCPWDYPGKNTGVGCHFLL